jgi:hypothetical protein
MSERPNPVDAHGLSVFPSLFDQFPKRELRSACLIGSYTFHEDHFLKFVESQSDEFVLRRISDDIESLASHANASQRDLAEVGILESLVSSERHRIALYLGPAGAIIVARFLPRFTVDLTPRLKKRKR